MSESACMVHSVCMCAHVHTHTYARMYIHVYIQQSTQSHMHTYVYTHTWNHTPVGIAGFMLAAKKYAVGTSQTQAMYIRMPAWEEGRTGRIAEWKESGRVLATGSTAYVTQYV